MGNTYYKWTFELETGTLEVKEISCDGDILDDIAYGDTLDKVDVSIDRLGTSHFYMYSKHNDKIVGEKNFFMGIADILQSDMSTTARMYNLALGRSYKFNEFLQERKEEGKK